MRKMNRLRHTEAVSRAFLGAVSLRLVPVSDAALVAQLLRERVLEAVEGNRSLLLCADSLRRIHSLKLLACSSISQVMVSVLVLQELGASP